MDAARNALLQIYNRNERPDLIDKILQELDVHPLSVTLLATVAHENDWDNDRLGREWEEHRTDALRTAHGNGLAAAIEFSLASTMFKELGSDARGLLEVIAFYPQGVKETHVDWLFPTVSNINIIFDILCILSLTYRSNGYVTMLAPLQDYFRPRYPKSSPLLCATKEGYFNRLSVDVDPSEPGFEEAQWIASEDVNVEHLLDVFTSIDSDSDDVWDASAKFMRHLCWHAAPRQTALRSKIEQLSDDHCSKPMCLFELSQLFQGVGNFTEQKRLLIHALKLSTGRGDDKQVADAVYGLSTANMMLGLYEEGIQQAKEALVIYEGLGNTVRQEYCLISLACLLLEDEQLDAAEEVITTLHTIGNLPERGQEYLVCSIHYLFGRLYGAKGEVEEAIHRYNEGLRIASTFSWLDLSFWIHYSLAQLFYDQDKFDEAHVHLKQAKECAIGDLYLGYAAELDTQIWYKQRRLEDALSEALHALEAYGKIGAAGGVEDVRGLLRLIEQAKEAP